MDKFQIKLTTTKIFDIFKRIIKEMEHIKIESGTNQCQITQHLIHDDQSDQPRQEASFVSKLRKPGNRFSKT